MSIQLSDRSDKYRKYRDMLANIVSAYVDTRIFLDVSSETARSVPLTNGAITEKIKHILDLYEHTTQ